MNNLFVISGVFCALFTLLLLTKKNKGAEDRILATLFFLLTINCVYVYNFAKSTELYYVPLFSELNYAIPLLFGPLLYFYIRSLTSSDFRLIKSDWLHFIPFVVFLLVTTLTQWTNFKIEPQGAQLGFPLSKLILTPFYLFAGIRVLRNYHRRFLDEYSFEMEANIVWMNWIVIGAIILWLIASISYTYNLFSPDNKILLYDYYTMAFLSFFLFGLTFVAVKNTTLFHDNSGGMPSIIKLKEQVIADKTPQDATTSAETEVQERSTKNIEEQDLEQLITAMQEDELFSDPLLTLAKLSTATTIPAYRISKVLKTAEKGSFYDFINHHRVERVKTLLNEGKAEQLSLLGIAEEAGFNSKASFNRVFKKISGLTPTQYLKNLKK